MVALEKFHNGAKPLWGEERFATVAHFRQDDKLRLETDFVVFSSDLVTLINRDNPIVGAVKDK